MIEGEGLLLRPPVSEDGERWLQSYSDPEELRFGVPAGFPVPSTLADLDERAETARAAWAARQPGSLVIAEADAPDVWLGIVAWRHDLPPQFRCADIGYVVHQDSRRRGIGGRALRTLVRWLTVDEDGPHHARVQLDHSVENIPSCRVALGAGLEIEGVRRSYLPLRDPDSPDGVRRHDVCLHGVVSTAG